MAGLGHRYPPHTPRRPDRSFYRVRFWKTHTLAENTRMVRVMDRVGTKVSCDIDSGLALVVHDISIP